LIQQERGPDARREVEPVDDTVAIQSSAKFEIPPGVGLPPILREQREVRAAVRLDTRGPVVDRARERAVRAEDEHRRADAVAVELVAQQIEAELVQMQPAIA